MFYVEQGQQRRGLTVGNAEPAEEILVKKSKAKNRERRCQAKTEMLVINTPNIQ
jgi:hypothetical protein